MWKTISTTWPSSAEEVDCHFVFPKIGAYQKLANLLRKQHLEPQADQWMDKLVKVNPKSAQAHFLRGRYLTSIPGRGDEGFSGSHESPIARSL